MLKISDDANLKCQKKSFLFNWKNLKFFWNFKNEWWMRSTTTDAGVCLLFGKVSEHTEQQNKNN